MTASDVNRDDLAEYEAAVKERKEVGWREAFDGVRLEPCRRCLRCKRPTVLGARLCYDCEGQYG